MKAIATAVAFVMLTATAWADEQDGTSAAAQNPIVLSEAEMDGITAGAAVSYWDLGFVTLDVTDPGTSSTARSGFKAGKQLKDSVTW